MSPAGAAIAAGRGPASERQSPRVHAPRGQYGQWLREVVRTSPDLVRQRLGQYDRFIKAWPDLEGWFAAPLRQRLDLDVMAEHGRRCPAGMRPAHQATPYLCYLGFMHGVRFDVAFLLSIRASYFRNNNLLEAFGLRSVLLEHYTERLVELGYSIPHAKTSLIWGYSRLMLWRGDPDAGNINGKDLITFTQQIRDFYADPDSRLLSEAFRRGSDQRDSEAIHAERRKNALSRATLLHTLLFNIGQVSEPSRRNSRHVLTWRDHMTPPGTPEPIRRVIERWLVLVDGADVTTSDAAARTYSSLHDFVVWLIQAHPEVTNLAELTREHIEDYLGYTHARVRQRDGRPLALSTRRTKLTELRTFLARTREWEWADVPAKPLFTRQDIPKPPKVLPRHIPRDQLDRLMEAANRLPDRQQRAALLVARWSGARSDEIRRLTIDCLDHYRDGHPRLRVPVGKGMEERLVPLHPQAADALAELIEKVKAAKPAARYDRRVGRQVVYLFSHHGQLRGKNSLFNEALRLACEASGLVDGQGKPAITMHRFRHTVGTQLAEGGARVQTIMSILGHKSAQMANVYIHLSDATIRTEYEHILSAGGRIAGPAAESVLADAATLTDRDIDWLKTNFFKTELELGHCLRLPQEGPCECDLYLNCSKFVTTSEHAPRLRARIQVQRDLIADAQAHGWTREVERHTATLERITELLDELGEPIEGDLDESNCHD